MNAATIDIHLPKLFGSLFPLGFQDVAIETAPLQCRAPQAIMADMLHEISDHGWEKNYVIISRRKSLLNAQLTRWVEASDIQIRKQNDGYRFGVSGSNLLISSPDDFKPSNLPSNLPFTSIHRLLLCEAESTTQPIFAMLDAMVRAQTVVVGEFCARDHWFYKWSRSTDVRLVRLGADQICATYEDQQKRYGEMKSALAGDAFRRCMLLEDIEVARKVAVDYLTWMYEVMPHHTELPMSKMHLDLNNVFQDLCEHRAMKDVTIGPRGSAKSTHFTEGFPLFCVCHGLEKYILIMSDTTDQACKHIEVIRSELESNEKIAEKYPECFGPGPVWKNNAIVTRNGIRIEALGAGKKVRGRKYQQYRPTLIIGDDLEGDEAAYSKKTREHRSNWFLKGVMKAGGPTTNYVAVGSNIHPDGLISTLNRSPGWKSHNYQSIIKWPKNMQLWADWEVVLRDISLPDPAAAAKQFYLDHEAEMKEGSEVLWEELEDLYHLMLMRATDGIAAFESEKQNNPIDPSLCEWGPHLFPGQHNPDSVQRKETRWYTELPKDSILACVCALDPSKGKDAKAGDYQGMVSVAIDNLHRLYVDACLMREPMEDMTARFVNFCKDHDADLGVCEEEQFQDLLLPQIEGSAVEEKVVVPIEGITTKGKKKEIRIRRAGPWINRGRIFWKLGSQGTYLLIKQFMEFPNSDHDDGPDAFEMALRRLLQIVYGDEADMDNPF